MLAQRQQVAAWATQDLEQVLAARTFTSWPQYEARVQALGYQSVMGLNGSARRLHEASGRHVALADLRPHGRDLVPQVHEAIAESQAKLVHGRIEVPADATRPAAERGAQIQAALAALGATAEVLPAPGPAGPAVVTYAHPRNGHQLDEVNKVLRDIQTSAGVTVREQAPGTGRPPADWPPRAGEYAQATIILAASATARAARG